MKRIIKNVLMDLLTIIKAIVFSMKTLFRGKRESFSSEKSKRVLILGNGPSINDIDLQKIIETDVEVACVNYYPLMSEEFFAIKPQYLCLFDPAFFIECNIDNEKKKRMFDILSAVDWELKIVCLQGSKLPIENNNLSYAWVTSSALKGNNLKKLRYHLYRHNLVICGFQNVIVGVLFFFISKNVKEIYLAGVDMSEFKQLTVGEDNNIYLDSSHFYTEKKMNFTKERHLKKGDLYKILGNFQTAFEQFYYMSEYAKEQGVKVYNLSPNSYLDVFEKTKEYLKRI